MNQIVKEFSFGNKGRDKVFKGVETLTEAVASTLGGVENALFLKTVVEYLL